MRALQVMEYEIKLGNSISFRVGGTNPRLSWRE